MDFDKILTQLTKQIEGKQDGDRKFWLDMWIAAQDDIGAYYYDRRYSLQHNPKLMERQSAVERGKSKARIVHELCMDCAAPRSRHADRCSYCTERYAEVGSPDMYDDFSIEPTAEYIRLMRDNDHVQQNLETFYFEALQIHRR